MARSRRHSSAPLTDLRFPVDGSADGEGWSLALRADTAGTIKLAHLRAIAGDGSTESTFGEVRGMTRSCLYMIPADHEPGHALYGPYLVLDPGRYVIRWCAFADQPGDANEPVLDLEILSGATVAMREAVVRGDLGVMRETRFEFARGIAQWPFEFRVSRHRSANLVLSYARLFREN